MKTDPNNACANESERLLWAIVHDALAHPLMAIFGYRGWGLAFHDYTSRKAWPRREKSAEFVGRAEDAGALDAIREYYRQQGVASVIEGKPTPDGYEYRLRIL